MYSFTKGFEVFSRFRNSLDVRLTKAIAQRLICVYKHSWMCVYDFVYKHVFINRQCLFVNRQCVFVYEAVCL